MNDEFMMNRIIGGGLAVALLIVVWLLVVSARQIYLSEGTYGLWHGSFVQWYVIALESLALAMLNQKAFPMKKMSEQR